VASRAIQGGDFELDTVSLETTPHSQWHITRSSCHFQQGQFPEACFLDNTSKKKLASAQAAKPSIGKAEVGKRPRNLLCRPVVRIKQFVTGRPFHQK
jgi:hypothetical protein